MEEGVCLKKCSSGSSILLEMFAREYPERISAAQDSHLELPHICILDAFFLDNLFCKINQHLNEPQSRARYWVAAGYRAGAQAADATQAATGDLA